MYLKIFNSRKITAEISNENKVYCTSSELLEIKQKLNDQKNKFNKFVAMGIFGKLMSAIDTYIGLKPIVTKEFGGQIVTNAWLKMYELMMFCDDHLFPSKKSNKNITAFHNAELPGAFISAVNHYLSNKYPKTKYKWAASSYWPDENNTALEDMYCMHKNYKKNWLMAPGDKTNGDMMRKESILYIVGQLRKRFPKGVNLYTSDAGMDIGGDYDNQEEVTMALNFGQIICGLMCLAKGGCFITKQYTFYCDFNRTMIAFLAGLFDEFYIAKPHTSRPVNSEIYLVGKGYNGGFTLDIAHSWLDLLSPGGMDTNLRHVTLVTMDSAFENTDKLIKEQFKAIYADIQIKALEEAYVLMDRHPDNRVIREKLKPIVDKNVQKWLINNKIEVLPENAKFETCSQ